MFAIIDIETCGSKFEHRKGRITDICIVIHDGLQVVEKFSTLVNPECEITSFYTRLTGITNEMVENAPRFHEIAHKIIELTEGKVFVAHNVGFDYGFIKDEFASMGYKYKRETLCTVRLSRKLMPGKVSYSLGRLCDSLGIHNQARHRAEGDAMATAELFNRLLQIKAIDPQFKNKGVTDIMTTRIEKIKQYVLDKLPEECGVYYFLDKDQNIIYVGKSVNMYNRAMSHFNTKEAKGRKMLNELYNVDFVKTGNDLIALLVESEEIKKHKPKYNRVRKADLFTHSIDWFVDHTGIINFKIVAYEASKNAIQSFVNYASARERLDTLIDNNTLCLRYAGLTDNDSICFNHQIKKCNGICCGVEDIKTYNKRAQQIVKENTYSHSNFLIFDKGRTNDERAVILVKNGHYCGYAFFDIGEQITSEEQLLDTIKEVPYYPDADYLILSWIKKNKVKIKPLDLTGNKR